MSTTSTYPNSLRRWNVASWTLLVLYVLSLLVFAISVFNEDVILAPATQLKITQESPRQRLRLTKGEQVTAWQLFGIQP